MLRHAYLLLLIVALLLAGCRESSEGTAAARGPRDSPAGPSATPSAGSTPNGELPAAAARSPAPRLLGWRFVDELPLELALFEGVFWDARDSRHLRRLLSDASRVRGKSVLEIGTGGGLLALVSLHAGAHRVVATDLHPVALANASYNADRLGLADRLELRQVPRETPSAFSVIGPDERFDLIVSNPPWEDAPAATLEEFAFADEGFRLLRSLLDGLPAHLAADGRVYLCYGCTDAIRTAERLAAERGLRVRRLDDRPLDSLPRLFLPGMVLEIDPLPGPAGEPALPGQSR